MEKTHACCLHHKRPWYKEPFYIILMVLGAIFGLHLILSYFGISILAPVLAKFLGYLSKTWWAILLGVFIGGLIDVFVPEKLMIRLLASGRKSIILAIGLGFLASGCSHGILAIAISLYKKGASTAATLAFLLAAPWANLAITLLLFSLFGLRAFLIVGGALLVAIVSGFIFQYLEERGLIEGKGRKIEVGTEKMEEGPVQRTKLFKKVVVEAWTLTKSVGWWVLLGFLLASFLGTYIPESIIHRWFGPSLLGLVATLALASIIEVCSEGSAPMAFELFEKTRAFGNTFVFLQAGVVTDFTEIGLVWTNIGKRAAMALVIVGVPLILVLGFLFNRLVV